MSNQKDNRPHWKKIFKSDHLGVYDLDEMQSKGSDLTFTIDYAMQFDDSNKTKVAGRIIAANIIYFKEGIKPMVVNSGNAKILQKLSGSGVVPDWAGTVIRLYADPNVKMKGEVVGGIKIYPNPVQKAKQNITKENKKLWENVKKAYIRDKDFKTILQRANISQDNQNLMIQEVDANELA